MDNIQFGRFVAQLRKEQNLTQKELAERLHVTDKAVSKWETGVSHSSGYHTTNSRLHCFPNTKFWGYTL